MSEEEKIEQEEQGDVEEPETYTESAEDEQSSAEAILDEVEVDDSENEEPSEGSSSEETAPVAPKEPEMVEPMDSYPVLIIDDDKWIQRIFSQYLTSWGFEHVAAATPFEGTDVALKNKPILIFLDIIMPEVTGDVTLKFIKGIEELKDIPVVIISGKLNKEVLKTTYKDGATGFISKPFTKDILFSKVIEVVDKKIINRMAADGLIDLKLAKKRTHIAGI